LEVVMRLLTSIAFGSYVSQVSTENGSIVCSSARWPLMIDPQLQVRLPHPQPVFHIFDEVEAP
jgi:hypothetical protein